MILPATREQQIQKTIEELWPKRTMPALAREVLAISDGYLAGEAHPWKTPEAAAAYLAYFYPLNYTRAVHVFSEAHRLGVLTEKLHDFGSGPQVVFHVLCDFKLMGKDPQFSFEELEPMANETAERIRLTGDPSATPEFNEEVLRDATLTASYSLNELDEIPAHWWNFSNWVLIEPSTFSASQKLISLRADLQRRGYKILAPCTHQMTCPLQAHPRDWCHMRSNFEPPTWWAELEKNLPMRNRTLTYSYLIASRQLPPAYSGKTRLIGDTLLEKGRSRQLVCQSELRQEITWMPQRIKGLKKDFQFPRGALIDLETSMKSQIKIGDPREFQVLESLKV